MSQKVIFFKVFVCHSIFSRVMAVSLLCCYSLMLVAQDADEVSLADAQTKGIISYVQHVMGFNRAVPQEKVYMHFDNTWLCIKLKTQPKRKVCNGAPKRNHGSISFSTV